MYATVIQEGLKIGSADSPVAQATKLGWVLTGPTSVDESLKPKGLVHGLHTSVEPTLSEVLSKFWQIEEVPSIPLLSPISGKNMEMAFRLMTASSWGPNFKPTSH